MELMVLIYKTIVIGLPIILLFVIAFIAWAVVAWNRWRGR